jgi:LysM repeat protein
MNLRCAGLLGVVSFMSLVRAADVPVEFSGVMTAGKQTRIALTDTASKTTTWVEPGQVFKGYTVARYDSKEEAVFLKKSGQETRLSLASSKATEAAGPAVAANATTPDLTVAAIRANLRHLAQAARQYQNERGVSSVGFSDLVGPGKPIKELRSVAGENYSALNFGPHVTAVSVTTATGVTVPLELMSAITTGVKAPSPAATAPSPEVLATAPQSGTPTTGLAPTGRVPVTPNYTVQNGDTWEKISAATGVPVQQLKEQNPTILEGHPLPIGQSIKTR